jgi:DNA repair exonuclease SbcCD ATPase subunit
MNNTDNLFDETVETIEFNNKIKTLQEKLPAILDDFKKYYVFFNKNPTYSEYQQIYENLKDNLNTISNELITITNDVEKNTKNIGEFLLKINQSIEKEKNKNIKLKSIESNINNSYNGSRVMINEYKEMYNSKYYNNIFMFIGIIISGATLVKVFANKNAV